MAAMSSGKLWRVRGFDTGGERHLYAPPTAGNVDGTSGPAPATSGGLPVQQGQMKGQRADDQARREQIQDQSPPGGEPVGAAEVADQQARIRAGPAWPAPQEGDGLWHAAGGEAEAARLLRQYQRE